jgi:hypothetical protein
MMESQDYFKLWTFQPAWIWEELQKKGSYSTIGFHRYDDEKPAYNWLKEQMSIKIGAPPTPEVYPIWAWYQFYDQKRKKPPINNIGSADRGTEMYRLEILKPKNEVVLSDFDLWHSPFSYHFYIGNNEEDSLRFDKILEANQLENLLFKDYPKHLQDLIVKSWDKIFDLSFDDPYFTKPIEKKSIQATFWELHLDEVQKVDKWKSKL